MMNSFNMCRFGVPPWEVVTRMEGLPIKDTMLSDMCPDVESAFCFPHKVHTAPSIGQYRNYTVVLNRLVPKCGVSFLLSPQGTHSTIYRTV